MTLDDALTQSPIVAILRGVRPDEVLGHAEALYAAGVRGLEVPLNSPDPLESLGALSAAWGERMAIGAGTVLSPDQVEAVARAGGQFVVSPNTDASVIVAARRFGLEPAPGFATATETFAALAAGARHLKLFPAVTYGPGHLRQLQAVLPAEAVVWAVGGVGPDSLAAWWDAGARAFGLGGELYRAGQPVGDTLAKATKVVAAVSALGL